MDATTVRASVERTEAERIDVATGEAEELEPEPAARRITLPVLPWPTPAGLRLLAENP